LLMDNPPTSLSALLNNLYSLRKEADAVVISPRALNNPFLSNVSAYFPSS